jgi:hypothetical protein
MDVRVVRIVVDVRDGDVIDGRVADVDSLHILAARVIGGYVHLSRTERKPRHIAGTATD